MKVIAIYSNKGGVGKTTLAVNLSYLSAKNGNKTLICDLDPQSSSTFYFRVKPKLKDGAKLLKKTKSIDESIKGTDFRKLDILPADFTHRKLDTEFDDLKNSASRLKNFIKFYKNEYDIILLDCPPSISILAESIFELADLIITPLVPTTLSIRSHKQLLDFIKKGDFKKNKFHAVFSMADQRKSLHRSIINDVPSGFRLLKTVIPFSSVVEKMGIHREPVLAFSANSKASKAFKSVWGEVHKLLK